MKDASSDELVRLMDVALQEAEAALQKHLRPIALELLRRQVNVSLASLVETRSETSETRPVAPVTEPGEGSTTKPSLEGRSQGQRSSAPERVRHALSAFGSKGMTLLDLVSRTRAEDEDRSTVRKAITRLIEANVVVRRDDLLFLAPAKDGA